MVQQPIDEVQPLVLEIVGNPAHDVRRLVGRRVVGPDGSELVQRTHHSVLQQ